MQIIIIPKISINFKCGIICSLIKKTQTVRVILGNILNKFVSNFSDCIPLEKKTYPSAHALNLMSFIEHVLKLLQVSIMCHNN
jgi:hypothetical protein